MKVLLVGGTGFIGRALAKQLCARGHGVHILSRSIPSQPLPEGVDHFRGDVVTAKGVAEAASGCEAMVYLAAREDAGWLPRGDSDGSKMFELNVLGTHRTLTAARAAGVRRAIAVTSCATFGIGARGETIDGSEPVSVLGLHSPYVLSRIQQEHAALDTARADFRVTCAAPSAVVGREDEKFFGPVLRLVERFPVPAVPQGGFNFITVEDVCVGLANLAEGRGARPRYLFVCENMAFWELAEIVATETGRRPPRMRIAPAAVRGAIGLAHALGRLTGMVPGMAEAAHYLNQRGDYDGALTAEEVGLPQSPVRPAMRAAVQARLGERLGRASVSPA